jgi:hypothetical protein
MAKRARTRKTRAKQTVEQRLAAPQYDLQQALSQIEQAHRDFETLQGELAIQAAVNDVVRTQIERLEAGRPKNALRLKPRDGHHHMESIRVQDSGTDQGFGYGINFRHGMQVTRGSWPNNRLFTVDAAGAICYDYIVDADWPGAEGASIPTTGGGSIKFYSTIQAPLNDIESDNQDKWYMVVICPGTYPESLSWPSDAVSNVRGISLIGIGGGGIVRTNLSSQRGSVIISGANSLTSAGGAPFAMELRDLVLSGSPSFSVTGSALNARAERCRFEGTVDLAGPDLFEAAACDFWNDITIVSPNPEKLVFRHCWFDANCLIDLSGGGFISHFGIEHCVIDSSITLGDVRDGRIIGNIFTTAARDAILDTAGLRIFNLAIENNVFAVQVLSANAMIRFDATAALRQFSRINITGNIFAGDFGSAVDATTAYIKLLGASSREIRGVTVAHNTFGHDDNTDGGSIESQGGFSVIADYVERSIFGPNTPVGNVLYKVTNGANNLFIPPSTAADTDGSPADTVDGILYDAGGLDIGWRDFITREDNVINSISASTLTLADDDTSYVEVVGTTVSHNVVGYSLGSIPLGIVVISSGDIVSIAEETAVLANTDIFQDFYNGTFLETLDADISEAGGVVTLSLQQEDGGDLTMLFSTGLFILDTTPAATIALTVDSDASPQANYIYIPIATKVLTKSTSQWPATEHIKVGYYLIPSATFVSNNGPYIQQQWNDHQMGTDNMGHMAHMAERERLTSARYFSGIDPNGTTSYLTIAGATVYYKATSGIIHQMHPHSSPAVNTDPGGAGDVALVTNWNGDAFHALNNLFDIVDDSGGNTIGNNKWFNLVIWGVANKSGTYEPVMINLPAGFYNTQASAEQDISAFDNFDLPREFDLESSTAFLIARLTIQKQAGSWAFGSVVDLRRGDLLGARGGASSSETEFPDNALKVFDATDNTKVGTFQLDQVAAGNTRELTWPDASGTIALTSRSDGAVPFVIYIPLGTDIDGAPVTP